MKKCKMKQLALAVGVALGGMGLMPSAHAVNLATDGLGQVLIFPYYTTRGGWNTLFNITNTSNQVVALKVRFHEAYNSRDVFDFNVIMSPFDVWNGWVENGPNDIPVFKTEDKTCTVPSIPLTGVSFDDGVLTNGTRAYTGDAADGGPVGTDRMREGYLEVTMMGATSVAPLVTGTPDSTPYARAAIHSSGTPANCQKLVDGFTNPTLFDYNNTTAPYGLWGEFQNYGGLNPLKGFYTLVNVGKGLVAGGSAVTLANFRTAAVVTMQLPPESTGLTPDTLAYQESFHEPSFNAATTPGTVLNTADAPQTQATAGNYTGADQVSWLLLRNAVTNYFTKRTDSQGWTTAVDWVLSHPTKAFYVDRAPNQFAAINPGRGDRSRQGPSYTSPFPQYFDNIYWPTAANPTGDNPSSASASVKNGKSCSPVSMKLWDREEKTASQPVFSPAPVGQNLCYEVNVLTFDNSKILVSGETITNNVGTLPGRTGWMQLNLGSAANAVGSLQYGLPVTGFAISTRDTGDGNLNEAFLIEHSYTRIEP